MSPSLFLESKMKMENGFQLDVVLIGNGKRQSPAWTNVEHGS